MISLFYQSQTLASQNTATIQMSVERVSAGLDELFPFLVFLLALLFSIFYIVLVFSMRNQRCLHLTGSKKRPSLAVQALLSDVILGNP